MNYSHYLAHFSSEKSPQAFLDFISDAQQIVQNAPEGAGLCGKNPERPPVINDRLLIIGSIHNPSPFSRLRISMETGPVHRYPLTTVRTDRHSYDSVVCACLLAFLHHFPEADITSDGTDKDWAQGIALYEFTTERACPPISLRKGWDLEL